MQTATVTGGAIGGTIAAVVVMISCAVGASLFWRARKDPYDGAFAKWCAIGCAALVPVSAFVWWWSMAFTFSGDYHSWSVKQGKVDRVAKRLIATDNGMAERYVVTIAGRPYGIDDTRATLLKAGDFVSLRCKKDWEWGVPRSANGWACRWNGAPR